MSELTKEQRHVPKSLERFYKIVGMGLLCIALVFAYQHQATGQDIVIETSDPTAASVTSPDEIDIIGGKVVTQTSQVKVLSVELDWSPNPTTIINTKATASGVDMPPLGGCDKVTITAKHAIPGATSPITLTNALDVDTALPSQVITAPLSIYIAETSTLLPSVTDIMLLYTASCLPQGSVHQLTEATLGFDGILQGYGQYEPNKYDGKLRQLQTVRKLTGCVTAAGHTQACYKSKNNLGLATFGDSGAPLINATNKTEAIYTSNGELVDGNGEPVADPYLLAEIVTAGLIKWVELCGNLENYGTEAYKRECEVHSQPYIYRPLDKHAYLPVVSQIDAVTQ